MTSTQLVVVALIAVAFGAGWILRGQAEPEDAPATEAAGRALGRAFEAYAHACERTPTAPNAVAEAVAEARREVWTVADGCGSSGVRVAALSEAVGALDGLHALLTVGQCRGEAVNARLDRLAAARQVLRR